MTTAQYIHGRHPGFTLVELLIALSLAALLLTGIAGIAQLMFDAQALADERNRLQRDARFAMERMTTAIGRGHRLLLPLADVPASNWRENVREQTVPASPPEGDSLLATAVLALTLGPHVDLDGDGFGDADNDRDGQFDEDLSGDAQNDGKPGIALVDDDGDGLVDEGATGDDDERRSIPNEDAIDGVDNDGDNNVDEDPSADMNGDGAPGLAGVDDDGDGQTDEGNDSDDDEDGRDNEDWWDPVVFYLNGSTLMRRQPVPWDENASGDIDGLDYVASPLADDVTRLRIERLPPSSGGEQLIDITLELTGDSGAHTTLHTRVRLGATL